MKKNRIKMTQPALKSRAEAESTIREICELTLERNRAQTDMDAELTAIRERYEEALGETGKTILEKTELVRAWAEANPTEFGAAKSVEFVNGVIGWRTGQPTLKTLPGFTFDRVLEKLKGLGFAFSQYIRTKEEVNKQALIQDRENLRPEQLRAIGVKVVQDESFFIEPNLEQLDNRAVSAAA